MTDFTRGLDRRTFIFGAAALGAATLLRPTLAFAEPTSADKFAEADSVRARINEMQEQLTIAGENYYKALDEHEAAVQAVADAQARIDEANARIAELQDKLSKRARSMYRSGQTTALDVILGATTFEEFATSWDLLNDINDNDAAMVQQTKDLRAEVEAAKIELEKQERIAAEKAEEAARIKAEAEQTIQTLEATLQQLDAEAQAAAGPGTGSGTCCRSCRCGSRGQAHVRYSTPSASIPSQLGGGLRAVAHRLPLRVGCRRSERIRLLRIGDVGIRSSGYFGAPSDRVDVLCRRRAFAGLRSATRRCAVDQLRRRVQRTCWHRLQCRGHALRSRPHVWRARARYRSAELGRVYACAPIRIRRRTK